MELQWTKTKPDFACVFVARRGDDYGVWQFEWLHSTDGDLLFYLAWLTDDGDEFDDIEECEFDEYLILKLLPTMDEVRDEIIKGRSHHG